MAVRPNILVVEDEPLIRFAMRDWLESAGYKVTSAANASAAKGLIDQLSTSLKALITDIRLGDGECGWNVAHYARSVLAHIPVIYITGDSQADWKACGVDDSTLFEKPVLESQLLRELDKRL